MQVAAAGATLAVLAARRRQPAMSEERPPLVGRLLVAAPPLHDPNFFRTVILLLDHDEHGALGLVLNRPGELVASDVVAAPRAPARGRGDPLRRRPRAAGGRDRPRGVPRSRTYGAEPVVGPVGCSTPTSIRRPARRRRRVRAFQGYAGWGPGQLEGELGEEAWIVAPRAPPTPSTTIPTLWRRALERFGGRDYSMVARMPDDPVN